MRNRIPLPPADPNLARTLELLRQVSEAVQTVHANPQHGQILPQLKPRNLERRDRTAEGGDPAEG